MPVNATLLPLTIGAADFGWIVLGLFIMFTALSGVVLSLVWLERKALGRLQRRLGPTRTGPMGLMQPVADALKLILKEDIIPSSSEKAIFWAAPLIVVISAFMIWVTIRDPKCGGPKPGIRAVLRYCLLRRGHFGTRPCRLGLGQ